MEEETKMEKALSPEARAEAVARFADALNRDDIDGFVFGVSDMDGNMSIGLTGCEGTLTHIMAKLFVDAGLDLKMFAKCVVLHMVVALGKEADND